MEIRQGNWFATLPYRNALESKPLDLERFGLQHIVTLWNPNL